MAGEFDQLVVARRSVGNGGADRSGGVGQTDAAELPPLGEAGLELAVLHKAIDRMRLRSEHERPAWRTRGASGRSR